MSPLLSSSWASSQSSLLTEDPWNLPDCAASAASLTPCVHPPPLPSIHNDTQLFQDFHLGEMVGEGRYGAVWECTRRASGARLACKQVDKESSPTGAVELELACLAGVQGHPNILHLEWVYEGRSNLYLVTEMCNAGDLYDHIHQFGHLPETEALPLFQQVVAAVHHCHVRGVVHRDLKPENVLLHRCPETGHKSVRLADFGLATVLENGGKTTGWVGSKPYEAPEVIAQQEYDSSADVFSLGVLLYSMLSGNWPSFSHLKQFLVEKSFNGARWSHVSAKAKDLITRMLSHHPKMRPTTAKILQDVWFYPEWNVNSSTDDSAWRDCSSSSLSQEEMEAVLMELLGGKAPDFPAQAVDAMELEELDLELHL